MDELARLRRMLEHDEWSREQFLREALALTDEEFTRDLGPGLRTLRERFTHIVDIDALWLGRMSGRNPPGLPDKHRLPNARALAAENARVLASRRKHIAALTAAALSEEKEFKDTRGNPYRLSVGDMLSQVVVHAAHHRGQVSLCLKALGRKVADNDLYLYYGGGNDGA